MQNIKDINKYLALKKWQSMLYFLDNHTINLTL